MLIRYRIFVLKKVMVLIRYRVFVLKKVWRQKWRGKDYLTN